MFSKTFSVPLLLLALAGTNFVSAENVAAPAAPTPLAKRTIARRQGLPQIDVPDILGDLEDHLSQSDAVQSLASEEVSEQVSFIDSLFQGHGSLDSTQVAAASSVIYSIYSEGAGILSDSADPNYSSIAAQFSSGYLEGASALYTSAAASIEQSLGAAASSGSVSASTAAASPTESKPSDSDGAISNVPSGLASLAIGSLTFVAAWAVL